MPPRSQPQTSKSGVRLWALEVQGDVTCADYDGVSHFLALGFEDGHVQLLDANGQVLLDANVGKPVRQVRLLPVKKRLAALDEYSHVTGFDFSGKQTFRQDYDAVWTSVEAKGGFFYLWGWKAETLKVDGSGRVRQRLPLPSPRRVVRAVGKKDQFWIVHNQVSLGLYTGHGANLWLVNCPAAIDLGRDRPSEIVTSDSGDALAICCFDKGVYIFDGEARTLRHIDLDGMVNHIDVSGSGDYLLLSDPFHNVYMVDREAQVVWQTKLDSGVDGLFVDRKGDRVLTFEESGVLSCHKFVKDTEARTDYLELTSFSEVSDKKEIWKEKVPPSLAHGDPVLSLSADGKRFLMGGRKDFRLLDDAGRGLLSKTFMTGMDHARLSDTGDRAFFWSGNELWVVDMETGKETQIGFYHYPLKAVGIDPEGRAFMTYDASGWVGFYSGNGKKKGSHDFDLPIRAILLNQRIRMAAFHTSPAVAVLLDLKTMKGKRLRLNAPIDAWALDDTGLYLGCRDGGCHRFNPKGERDWKFALPEALGGIDLLPRFAVFRGTGKHMFVLEKLGYQPEEAVLHSPRSVLTQHGDGILELAPARDAVSCYKVLTVELVWKIHCGSTVKALAASPGTNRLVVLDAKQCHYHQLIADAADLEDRSGFLEF
ncbi:hypothetical protein NITGR_480001 [Nitrospina gracilis 3/211]|uniref:Uncharacterized protein n=1 Tax=Nitrospina gracilis (strain 3/211) TaxID=1266370 RepID=M1YZG5_NITG3|nr:hypothetical protein [Nitrospina sp. Nb-3]MCF8723784.1 hypothetical protein [Nitrospina sp. Nb-3]CCQ90890.1 hypothetical protein NITGR_480001 [Nitrospina gracilis 3/211]